MIGLLSFLSWPILLPQTAGTARATAIVATFDMRALSPAMQPAAVEIDVPPGPRTETPVMTVSLAINGRVIARGPLAAGQGLHLRGAIAAHSAPMRNRIEVAVTIPGCDTVACRTAVANVRLRGAPRLVLEAADRAVGFAQLAPRYRTGMTIRLDKGVDPRFGTRLRRALAPLAPLKADGANLVIISRHRPIGLPVPLRFDLGSTSLVRGDGVTVADPAMLSDLTVVQILRSGEHPVIWVRPGGALPERMDLDEGNVALFGTIGRVLAYTTGADDRTLHPRYTNGPSVAAAARGVGIRRLVLLALWALGSIALLCMFRRLPRDPASAQVPSWAA